jgi:hypothetical protein
MISNFKEIPSYYDLTYSSKIFESQQIIGLSPDEIQKGENLYNSLVEKLQKNEPIDEGIFGAIIGGVTGALIGPAVGKAICKVLGIEENGVLGKLLTSRLVTTALGITIGK